MKTFLKKIFRISIEEDLIGKWKRVYIFNKCVHGKMLARWIYK